MELFIENYVLCGKLDDGTIIKIADCPKRKNARNYCQEILQVLSSGPKTLDEVRAQLKTSETNLYKALNSLSDKIVKSTVNRKAIYSLKEEV